MKILASVGRNDVAIIYIVQYGNGKMVECVESVQPPISREKKWVLLISTMFGCPIGCAMCDAGGHYKGMLTAQEILDQIDFLIYRRYSDGNVTSRQFKVQFARMGEPTLNPDILKVLEELPDLYNAPGLMPSISTVAPNSAIHFFKKMLDIKQERYADGKFQLQFSLHTTDEKLRDKIIPIKKLSFEQMAEYGELFFRPGDRKITLNFALAKGSPIESNVLLRHFSPDKFLVKITPLNPTYGARVNNMSSYIEPFQPQSDCSIVTSLRQAGYEVLVSIGEMEENQIGSNCGQYLLRHLTENSQLPNAYTYNIHVNGGGISAT